MINVKKGDSSIIAWVLLLGIAISTATAVFFWLQQQTETHTQKTTEYIEGNIACKEIIINAIPDSNCENIEIRNRGMLNIAKVKIRLYKNNNEVEVIENGQIPPKQSININIGNNNQKVEIVPLINITKNLAICNERSLFVEC